MAHTYVLNFVHLVFSTKDRLNQIAPGWEPELHAHFAGIARNKAFTIDCSGGTANHVHLLLRLPATIDLSSAVNALKANSSRWARTRSPLFAWQPGYSAFSVSYSGIAAVRTYIADQKQHHSTRSYEDELRLLLTKHSIPFDERHLLA